MAAIASEYGKDGVKRPAYRVAIIGCGPRGLSALESLIEEAARGAEPSSIAVTVFEPHRAPGAGPNYSPYQSDFNLLNIPHRNVELEGRLEIQLDTFRVPAFPSFDEWLLSNGYANADPNEFHPRNLMGKYLHARFTSAEVALNRNGILQLVKHAVTDISVENDSYRISAERNYCEEFEEVLLTIGHQPLALDEQLDSWKSHGESNNDRLWIDPYPTRRITESAAITTQSTVALRGFGLTMIDVVRALTEGRGGHFQEIGECVLKYERSGKEPRCLVPFSLNGLPLAPKPATQDIDRLYQPSHPLVADLLTRLQELIEIKSDKIFQTLWQGFAEIAETVWRRHHPENTVFSPTIFDSLNQWIDEQCVKSPHFLRPELTPEQIMLSYVDMARGNACPTLDYCAGQVWRHLQDEIYHLFSHCSVTSKVMCAVMELDESMKRFSYGPPIEQIRRLLALVDCGLLRFHVVDDPDINVLESGWLLCDEPEAIIATVMINTVIPSPVLEKVAAPLVKAMLTSRLLVCYADNLGAATDPEGHSEAAASESIKGLSLLGRLAAGSVMGSDSIHDCFSRANMDWASAVVRRASHTTTNQLD